MCLKYSIGSLKTHCKDAIYHMLAKIPKFSIAKIQYAKDNQDDLTWVVTWARKFKAKEWTNEFEQCEAI